HATPARSDHTNIGTLCATLFAPGVVPCAIIAPGSGLDSWCAHCDGPLRVMGLAMEHRFTNYHRVLNRATWSALQASRMLLGLLVARLVPPGAPIVLGAG